MSNPCTAANTKCEVVSGTVFKCVCMDGYLAISSNINSNGCLLGDYTFFLTFETIASYIDVHYTFFTILKTISISLKDPCNSNPCPANTNCEGISGIDYRCVCQDSFIPVKGNPKMYGCSESKF